jgi:hypothetical protein
LTIEEEKNRCCSQCGVNERNVEDVRIGESKEMGKHIWYYISCKAKQKSYEDNCGGDKYLEWHLHKEDVIKNKCDDHKSHETPKQKCYDRKGVSFKDKIDRNKSQNKEQEKDREGCLQEWINNTDTLSTEATFSSEEAVGKKGHQVERAEGCFALRTSASSCCDA